MIALIPGAFVGLAVFLFVAPFRQDAGAYEYVGDWRKPDTTTIYFAVVSTDSQRIVLGRVLGLPVHESRGCIRVGTRSLSTLGIDPEGSYALVIDPDSLESRLVDRMTGKLMRPMGRFSLDTAREIVSLNLDQNANPEWAKPVADLAQSIASGVPLTNNPHARADDGPSEAYWATWAVTALFGAVAWWANSRLMRQRIMKCVRISTR